HSRLTEPPVAGSDGSEIARSRPRYSISPLRGSWRRRYNGLMNTTETSGAGASRELQQAVDRVLKGAREPEAMRRAAERMDRMREAMPETNIAVELIREARD